MMAGTLEVKGEEEEIFDDVVAPGCLSKAPEERTDEEKHVIKAYEVGVYQYICICICICICIYIYVCVCVTLTLSRHRRSTGGADR